MITTVFYDDPIDEEREIPSSIFLAGPTARGVRRTPWRTEALSLLEGIGFGGTVLIPEFRDGRFEDLAPRVFGGGASPVAGMRAVSYNVLRWETIGIERSTVVLFWMPFQVREREDPMSLPGFTTRAEVAREIARRPTRIVLGMPEGAVSGGHIRFHAHRAGLTISQTLEDTVAAAHRKVGGM
ncbi:MAG: hypothetical protein HYV07_05080 [Deltaproteobacteria bacterium]|nr:hypothetical protein [Deltaproteobacteria bacterium]